MFTFYLQIVNMTFTRGAYIIVRKDEEDLQMKKVTFTNRLTGNNEYYIGMGYEFKCIYTGGII